MRFLRTSPTAWPGADGAAAAVLTALIATACIETPASEANGGGNDDSMARPARIEAASNGLSADTRRFVGRVEAVQTTDLSFQVGGKLVEMPVREGQRVDQGALLAALDSSDFERAVREAEVRRDLARQDLERKSRLLQSNSVSEAVHEQAQAEFDLREVALETARQNRDYTEIDAPFDALITRRLVDTQTNVGTGTAVLRIQDISELRINVNIPERLMTMIGALETLQAHVTFASLDGGRYPLDYREHETQPDGVTQTYSVSFALPDGIDPAILPGMIGRVDIAPRGAGPHEVSVPSSAVVADSAGGFFVWRVTGQEGEIQRQPVSVGPVIDDRVAITDGLSADDRVVTAGAEHLRPGMTVRPIEAF